MIFVPMHGDSNRGSYFVTDLSIGLVCRRQRQTRTKAEKVNSFPVVAAENYASLWRPIRIKAREKDSFSKADPETQSLESDRTFLFYWNTKYKGD
jgi:hypothetical protein